MTPQIPAPSQVTFNDLGIAPKLLEAVTRNHFVTPTPIQAKAIPLGIEGKDLIGVAETGTGKTLAFGIPLIQRIAATGGIGLILLPTRELALQVEESIMRVGRSLNLRTAVLIGGASMGLQISAIKRKPHLIIATPGRLIDHLEQRTVALEQVKMLVLDEADRMLDMGFAPQLNRILMTVPKERQTMLFSATMPPEIVNMARKYMQLPVQVEIARPGTAAKNVEQELYVVTKNDKNRLLQKILSEVRGAVLVFTRTKFGAKKVARSVRAMKHSANEIHSNRSLAQRREALEGFKTGKYRVLVATDIAARGIDVKGIELVINYDLPEQAEDYVHRIGRTGRASHMGKAISFAMPDQGHEVRMIEKLIRKPLAISKLPELPEAVIEPRMEYEDRPMRSSGGRPFRGGSHGGHRGGVAYGASRGGAPRTQAPAKASGMRFNPYTNTYDRPVSQTPHDGQRPATSGGARHKKPFGGHGKRPGFAPKRQDELGRPNYMRPKGPRKFVGGAGLGGTKF